MHTFGGDVVVVVDNLDGLDVGGEVGPAQLKHTFPNLNGTILLYLSKVALSRP